MNRSSTGRDAALYISKRKKRFERDEQNQLFYSFVVRVTVMGVNAPVEEFWMTVEICDSLQH